MSSALVRQALEFVDPDVSGGKRKKRGGKRKPVGQVLPNIQKPKRDSQRKVSEGQQKSVTPQQVIEKLLKLSRPVADHDIARKIAQRVTKGKPLVDKIKVNKEPQKSILFPED